MNLASPPQLTTDYADGTDEKVPGLSKREMVFTHQASGTLIQSSSAAVLSAKFAVRSADFLVMPREHPPP